MIITVAKRRRLLDMLPVLAAATFHAVALGRWLFALPVGIALAAVVAFDLSASPSRRRWLAAGAGGMLAGLVMPVVSAPPSGPLSPALVSALTGMLIGLAAFSVIARNVTGAWISAWVLVALSGNTEGSIALSVSLIAFMATSLIAAASLAGLFRTGPRVVLPLGLFAGLVALATAGIAVQAKRLDGALLETLETLLIKDNAQATAGIGRDITIDSRSSITLSLRPLLDLSAAPGLLRTHVMDRFDGRRWSASPELRSITHSLGDVPIRPESTRLLEMTPLDDLGDTLPSPAGTWDISGATPRVVGGWVMNGEAESVKLTLVGDSQERLPPEDEPGPENLEVPDELRAKLGPLAEQLTRKASTPREKAERIAGFFQHNFEYSLDTNLTGQEHPLVVLVKERRPAYCIYYASATALMLRSQGIAARIVSGFAPLEVNPITGRVLIRQRDAHAWVEAWLPEQRRFVALDPTPNRSRKQAIGQASPPGILAASAGAVRSGLRRTWLAWRQDPAGSLVGLAKSPLAWLLLAALLVLFLKQRRTTRTATARLSRIESSDPRLRLIYRRYLRSLRQAGVAPRPWETDDELIARLADTSEPQLAALATEFIAHYRRARFRGEAVVEHLEELAKLAAGKAG